eukprot:4853998-Pyramimonas_sp.AAC.1
MALRGPQSHSAAAGSGPPEGSLEVVKYIGPGRAWSHGPWRASTERGSPWWAGKIICRPLGQHLRKPLELRRGRARRAEDGRA